MTSIEYGKNNIAMVLLVIVVIAIVGEELCRGGVRGGA